MNRHITSPARAERFEFRGEMMLVSEIANAHGTTPCTIRRRIKAGAPLEPPIRKKAKAGSRTMIKDVTDETKRKPCDDETKQKPTPTPFSGPSREEVVAGQVRRLREPGSIIPVEEALDTAYTAGFAAGRASR